MLTNIIKKLDGTELKESHNLFGLDKVDVFAEVEEYPIGYSVWNIGRNNFRFEEYVPLAKVDEEKGVDTTSLKALKVGSEELALYLIDYDHYNKEEIDCTNFEKVCKKFRKKK